MPVPVVGWNVGTHHALSLASCCFCDMDGKLALRMFVLCLKAEMMLAQGRGAVRHPCRNKQMWSNIFQVLLESTWHRITIWSHFWNCSLIVLLVVWLLPKSLFWKLPTCANLWGCVTALCLLHLLFLGIVIHVHPEPVAETSALTFISLFAKSVWSLLWPLDILQLLNHKYADAKLSYPEHRSSLRRWFCCVCCDSC